MPVLLPDMPIMGKAMSREEIRGFRHSHRDAVKRARDAGYDNAYVYAAHDASLLWHLLSPAYNHRRDEYGGCFENRLRLLREVLEDAKEVAGDAMAIAIRFAVHEAAGPQKILFDGEGRDVVEALAHIPDLWDVNISGWARDSATSRYEAEGYQEQFVSFVKQVTEKPVLGVGRFTLPDTMVSQVRRGVPDLIGSARASIADPFLPAKLKAGRIEDIRECIGCNVCVAVEMTGVQVRCTQNPTMSEEWRRGWHPERVPATDEPVSILIVGAGPAGLEAALTLARAGHEVTVAEGSNTLGGRVIREARICNLSAWARVADYRRYQLQQMHNVSLYPGSALDAKAVAQFGADSILLATGSHWLRDGRGRSHYDPIPGFEAAAITPDEVLDGLKLAETVVIYDDDHDYMANAVAIGLAQRGHQVYIVSPMPALAGWMGLTLERPRMLQELNAAGVRMHPNTTATGWSENGLESIRTDACEVMPVIPAGSLLAVTLRHPRISLSMALQERGQPHRLIGDAEAPGTIQSAVYSGHRHARELLGGEPENRIFKREQPTLFN